MSLVSTLITAITDIETHINSGNSGACSQDFTNNRQQWVADLQKATNPEVVKTAILFLEKSFNPNFMNSNWPSRRSGWEGEMQQANSDFQIAKLLFEYEESINWSQVNTDWNSHKGNFLQKFSGDLQARGLIGTLTEGADLASGLMSAFGQGNNNNPQTGLMGDLSEGLNLMKDL